MLFGDLFLPQDLRDAVGEAAWLRGMLEFEGALAEAEAGAGLVPKDAADAIAAACRSGAGLDFAAIVADGRGAGNPAEPLVRALREVVGGDAARWVHHGATSQDALDTAAMLVARRALDLIDRSLEGVADLCARLAQQHRDTLMLGRTLMQPALPTTFGLKAAGWLSNLVRAQNGVRRVRREALALELGGPAGTLAELGAAGPEVLAEVAARLALPVPELAWHTGRARVGEIAAALGIAAGALDKVALDVILLAQGEVGEVSEAAGEGRGASSSMAHKRNPVGSVLARACARHAQAAAGELIGAMAQEHERAAGAWHAEWDALARALGCTGGAAAAVGEALGGLEVHADRMRQAAEDHAARIGVAPDPGPAGVWIDRALAAWRES